MGTEVEVVLRGRRRVEDDGRLGLIDMQSKQV